ncbi:MAG: pyridoxamine 5'-phosphate oxidase family protein [Hyphomicrobiales bacterium]
MDPVPFADIQQEFEARVRRIVWATAATVDTAGRPRVRLLHPVWEGTDAWDTTRPDSLKMKHLARQPYMSLAYWDPAHALVYADCKVELVEDLAEKRRACEYIKAQEPPYGFDPASIWPGPDAPGFALLRLRAFRIRLEGVGASGDPAPPRTWLRNEHA